MDVASKYEMEVRNKRVEMYCAEVDLYRASVKDLVSFTPPEDKAMPYQDEAAKMAATEVDLPVSDKHIQLDNALDSLTSVNNRLLALIQRIEGNDSPEEQPCARPCPALLDVLNEAPNRIREIESRGHELVSTLESHLFR